MLKKAFAVIAALLCFVIFLSGCNVLTLNSPENLVRPPKLSGDDGALQAAFEKAVAEKGWLGVFTGGLTATAGGITAAVLFGFLAALLFKPGEKR